MISESLNTQQAQTASPPEETTPELRTWSTPHVQSLNGAGRDTQGGTFHWEIENSFYRPS
jgi:hypothetical protein